MSSRNLRWAIFISGNGSNLNALLDARTEADVVLVVSSSPLAYGLIRARRAGIEVLVLEKPIDWNGLNDLLLGRRIERIFLAGFMKIVPADFVAKWEGRVFNIHPSLLPAYPGLKSLARSVQDSAPVGATVHRVNAEMDAGPHVFQRRVGTFEASDLARAEFLVHMCEHRLVRECIRACRSEAIWS